MRQLTRIDQRRTADALSLEARHRVNETILSLFREKSADDNYHKWDGAIFISANEILLHAVVDTVFMKKSQVLLMIERYLSWDVGNIEKSRGLFEKDGEIIRRSLVEDLNDIGYEVRSVSELYEGEFHKKHKMPTTSDFLGLYEAKSTEGGKYESGNGHGVLLLPGNHAFWMYCIEESPRRSKNRREGSLKGAQRAYQRGHITKSQLRSISTGKSNGTHSHRHPHHRPLLQNKTEAQ